MKRSKISWALCGALVLVGAARAASAASVGWSPQDISVAPGSVFSLDLVGRDFNAGDLDGGGVNVSFDPAVLVVLSVNVNVADWEFFSDAGLINNATGTITGILFNSFQLRNGDLFFATVQFQAIGAGISPLGLSEYAFNPFGTGGSGYPGLSFGPSVVTVVPVPAAAVLFGSALGVLGGFGRTRRYSLA